MSMAVYCSLCKKVHLLPKTKTLGNYYRAISCPNKDCRSHHLFHVPRFVHETYSYHNSFVIIHEVDKEGDYMTGVLCHVCHTYANPVSEQETDDKWAYLKKPLKTFTNIQGTFSVSRKEGFLAYKNGRIQRRNSYWRKEVEGGIISAEFAPRLISEATEYLQEIGALSLDVKTTDHESLNISYAITGALPAVSCKKSTRTSVTGLSL